MIIKHVIENGEPFSLLADGTKFFLNNNQYILLFSNALLVKQQFRYSEKATKIWSPLTYYFMLLMPCPFTDRKMFCTSPNFLSQPKNLTTSSKTFVPVQNVVSDQKFIHILCQSQTFYV